MVIAAQGFSTCAVFYCPDGTHNSVKKSPAEAGSDNKPLGEHKAPYQVPPQLIVAELWRVRRQTVEHPCGTIKFWMGSTHFLTKTLARVSTGMSLHVLAYNLKRVMKLLGIGALMQAIKAYRIFLASIRALGRPITMTLRAQVEKVICRLDFVASLTYAA